jgi:hypothetical protein
MLFSIENQRVNFFKILIQLCLFTGIVMIKQVCAVVWASRAQVSVVT